VETGLHTLLHRTDVDVLKGSDQNALARLLVLPRKCPEFLCKSEYSENRCDTPWKPKGVHRARIVVFVGDIQTRISQSGARTRQEASVVYGVILQRTPQIAKPNFIDAEKAKQPSPFELGCLLIVVWISA
jgi:hypothetical protein